MANIAAAARQKIYFDTPFGDREGELPVEAGRYRLLWTPYCPWAHRVAIVRKLLGLDEAISLGTANPVKAEQGWEFSLDAGGVDPVLGIRYLPEIYARSGADYAGRPTVPAVVDVKRGVVVNNDYFNLTIQLETGFKPLHRPGAPDLYPQELRAEIDALNEALFRDLNSGVYRAGAAQTQEAYEQAYDAVFARLDELEQRLSTRRYLFGDRLTDSDVRLYVTLARFDAAYYSAFRLNRNRLVDFPNLWAYARDLYQTPGFGDTTDFDAIKRGQQLGNLSANPYQLVAKGPDASLWNTPHHRS